jgi:S-(hydroxymethyl)glutathione dehydrogenase/alcohol dehydrogenase
VKTRAALLWDQPSEWKIEDVELDGPNQDEVLVRFQATGLCHSDDHFAKGDLPLAVSPFCGGHEAVGIVQSVGARVRSLKEGDRIITSFIPGCGHCRWCASGMQNLCGSGAEMATGAQLDGTYRMHIDGKPVARNCALGTFCEYGVLHEWSCVKVDHDIPSAAACLIGCGVPTGWGSAVNAANVQPGEVVIVFGTGGVGINAVQGAWDAGAAHVIAVDAAPFKREIALKVGATAAFADLAEAADHARSLTDGQGADSTIVTLGVPTGQNIGDSLDSIRKAGTVVMVGVPNWEENGIPVNLNMFLVYQKTLRGALFGNMSPSKDIPRLLDYYRAGRLHLDELVTTTYTLDGINQGYADMHAGKNVRGVVLYE